MNRYILILLALLPLLGFSQGVNSKDDNEKINKFNLSVQVGFPYLTGVNMEYLVPKTKNKLTITGDFGYVPINISSTNTSFKYYGIGANYYFLATGRGAYMGLDYGISPINTSRIKEEEVDYSATFQSFNSKLGVKLGKKVFVRVELGYSVVVYDLDAANDYLYNSYGIRINPSIDYLQFINGRLGVGISF